MSYAKHNFQKGDELLASQLNDIDNAIEALETRTNFGEGLFADYMGIGETEISNGRKFIVNKNKVSYIKSASSTAHRSCNLFGTLNIFSGAFLDIDISSQTFYDVSLADNIDLFITIEWNKIYTSAYNRFYVATKNPTTNAVTKLRFALDNSTSIVNQYNLFELVPAIKENGNFALFYENINTDKTNSAKYWLSAFSSTV